MPYVKNSAGESFHVTDELLEICPRCEGKGWYNYWPDANKLTTMFFRLIGGLKCVACHGSGNTLTEQGRAFVKRKEFEAFWDTVKEKKEPLGPPG